MLTPTPSEILRTLSRVQEPDLHQDLVSLNMIEEVEVDVLTETIRFLIRLTTPSCPLKDRMEADCRQVLREDWGESWKVEIRMEARTLGRIQGMDWLLGVHNLVMVASGKGGVGKTTVAVNLAKALRDAGAKVGLLDADLYGPNVPLMLGVEGRQPGLKDNRMIPVEVDGLQMMSVALLIEASRPLIWRGPMASNTLKQFFSEVDWGELDYLVLDLPPGTGDVQLTLTKLFPEAFGLLVTTPQAMALADALKAGRMFQTEGTRLNLLGMVENMAWFSPAEQPDMRYYPFGKGGTEALAQQLSLDILTTLPLTDGPSETSREAYALLAGEVSRRIAVHHRTQ
ncbi:MAG: Mrp/NBP35 family ATP-binding protein [Sphingomonadales bacterium]|nr:Mrp/NBP35 family ATP-binding protein [Sphingomonadales bacterium]